MPLVTTKEMFEKAYNGGYAIGAFNVNNMEIIQGITEAAIEKRAPLILQVSKGARAYAKHVYLMKLIEAAIEDAEQTAGFDLPIVVHLDHGDTFELCKSCIDGGFTSVMIDGSSKSFEDNIALTRQVVEYAHDHGVVVEGELGTLAGVEDEVKVSAEELQKKLGDECKLSGEPAAYFGEPKRTDSGSVLTVPVCGTDINGAKIRSIFDLRSLNFSVKYADGSFTFTVRGYGHGVGMSQYGANYMAKQGSDFKEILTYYYTGCKVEKIS